MNLTFSFLTCSVSVNCSSVMNIDNHHFTNKNQLKEELAVGGGGGEKRRHDETERLTLPARQSTMLNARDETSVWKVPELCSISNKNVSKRYLLVRSLDQCIYVKD